MTHVVFKSCSKIIHYVILLVVLYLYFAPEVSGFIRYITVDITGRPPSSCGQQGAGTSSEFNTGQYGQRTLEHPVRTHSGITLH